MQVYKIRLLLASMEKEVNRMILHRFYGASFLAFMLYPRPVAINAVMMARHGAKSDTCI